MPLAQTRRMVGVPKATDAKVCEAFVSVSVSCCETRGEEGLLRRDYWNRGSAARLMHMGNPHYPALLARASRRYGGFGEADGTTSVRSVRNGGAPRAGTDAGCLRTLGNMEPQQSCKGLAMASPVALASCRMRSPKSCSGRSSASWPPAERRSC